MPHRGMKLVVSNSESTSLNDSFMRKRSKPIASQMNYGRPSLIEAHAAAFTELAMVSPELASLLHKRATDWLHKELAYRAAGFTDDDVND